MGHCSKKSNAPFGVASKRFNKIGFHPELDVTGAMKKEITKAGPGSYNPQHVTCKGKHGVNWKTKLEVEEFSKNLGYRNANLLYEREFYKSLRGPGANDINEEYYKKSKHSVIPNTGLGTGDRFRSDCDDTPPPGTYQRMNKMSTLHLHQFSNVMSFEWDGFLDRFRSKDPPYLLAPNRYDTKDGKGLDALLNKVVSLRGPYDLFTGPRDGSTIKNHLAPSKVVTPEYGYIKPSDIEILLNHPLKKRCGKFSRAPRYTRKPVIRSMLNDISLCYKNPNDPGPAHYNLSNFKSTVIKKKSLYPFDTSKVNARPPLEWKIFPGPGRYNSKLPRCLKVRRATWVFLSTCKRDLFKVSSYSAF